MKKHSCLLIALLATSSAFSAPLVIQPPLPSGISPAFDFAPIVKEFKLTGGNMAFSTKKYPEKETMQQIDKLNPVLTIQTEKYAFERYDCINPKGIRIPLTVETSPQLKSIGTPAHQAPVSISKLNIPGENVVLMSFADLAFEMQTLQFPQAVDPEGMLSSKLSESTAAIFENGGFKDIGFLSKTLYRSIYFLTGENSIDELNGEGVRPTGEKLVSHEDTLEIWHPVGAMVGCNYSEPLNGSEFVTVPLPSRTIEVYKLVK